MGNEIYEIYKRASDYINGENNESPLSIINDAYDVLSTIGGFEDLSAKCAYYINRWVEEDTTLEEYVAMGYELVEELSGTLGEWLDR